MQSCMARIAGEQSSEFINEVPERGESNGSAAVREYGVKGARQMAADGYSALFADWLPFYRGVASDPWRLQKTLLRIMSTLDDTCVIHRAGYGRAQEVKREAAGLLRSFSPEGLEALCGQYAREGVSPGGAADMLSLTVFIESILN